MINATFIYYDSESTKIKVLLYREYIPDLLHFYTFKQKRIRQCANRLNYIYFGINLHR